MSRSSRPSPGQPLAGRRGLPASAGAPWPLVVALFVVALVGRFSFSRLGDHALAAIDLRFVGSLVLLAATFVWANVSGRAGATSPQTRYLQMVFLFFAYQAASALWAPEAARTTQTVLDIATLAALVLVTMLLAVPDPQRACTVFLVLIAAAGSAYAVAGLFFSTADAQGRISAFGGGPNVFVRVVGLGLIAVLTLALTRRVWLVLIVVPLLIAAIGLSGSRGGLLAAAVTACVGAWCLRRFLSARRVVPALIGAGACLAVVAAWLGPRLEPLVNRRYALSSIEEGGFSTRPELLDRALDVFRDHVLAGGGLDSFYAYSGQLSGIYYPHNYVAAVAADGGLVGLVLLVLTVAALLRGMGPVSRLSGVALGCALGAVFIATASMFSGDYYDSRFAWILATLAVCAGTRGSTSRSTAEGRAEGRYAKGSGR
jgi:O-antigen ligase